MFCVYSCTGGGYLANVAPSDYSRIYEQELPESIGGAAFLKQYSDHWDTATQVHLPPNRALWKLKQRGAVNSRRGI